MPNETETLTPEALPTPIEIAPEPDSIFQPPTVDTSVVELPADDIVQADDMPFAALLKDVRRAAKRSGNTKSLGETRLEFSRETYPLLEAVIEAIDERFGRLENAFDEMVEQTESFLQPDLSIATANVLNIGKALAQTLLAFKAGQRLSADGEKKLHALANQYLQAVEPVAKALAEATLDPGADDDDDDDAEGVEEDKS